MEDRRTVISVRGPVNTFRKDRQLSAATFTLHVDAESHAARIDLEDGSNLVLLEGEWSDWIRVRFRIVPGLKHVAGMFRLYLREIRPVLRLYASPVNIDPLEPELPISTPDGLSRELATTLGLFHTLGNPEDTSALRAGVLDYQEYLARSRGVLAESLRLFEHELERFASGFFFYYFSGLDQNSHVLWGRHEADLLEFYRAIDAAVGRAMTKAAGDAALIVMSDHGFASFERAVHLNTWLMKEGCLTLDDPRNIGRGDLLAHVVWPETQAYALGLNGLYLNLKGRESDGRVTPGSESELLLRGLIGRLREFRDPDSGRLVVQSVYRPTEVYRGNDLRYAPDLIIGYAPGYRSSW